MTGIQTAPSTRADDTLACFVTAVHTARLATDALIMAIW